MTPQKDKSLENLKTEMTLRGSYVLQNYAWYVGFGIIQEI